VALDWLEDGCPESAPIVIILPGLTGESQAEYIKCLVNSASRIKLRVVVFNNRGLGGIPLKVFIIIFTFIPCVLILSKFYLFTN